ncbi:MAG: hypothetical protein U0271_01600 [Polyangiaceae bacterium]
MRRGSLGSSLPTLLATAFTLVARPVLAASFDENGELTFDPEAIYTNDFETDLPPSDNPEGPSLTKEDAGALHGARVLVLDAFQNAGVSVELPATAMQYRVSAWVRERQTVADVEVVYDDNGHPGVDELAMLYPTGRVTSDGWVEVANEHVRIQGQRGAHVEVGFFSAVGSSIDDVEVVPNGSLSTTEISGETCAGTADPVCSSDELCLFSQCRYQGGLVPDLPADRDAVAAYLAARADLLFGPLLNRELDLPNADVVLDRMRTAATPWAYWNAFTLAVRKLHDGHTSTSSLGDFVFRNERPIGLCFIEGDADLSHELAPKDPLYLDVLVSHTAASRTLGLVPGDRLVAVDGMHPIAWARAQGEQYWGMSPTSNHRTYAELAETLRGLVARLAHEITVIHCDPATLTCAQPFVGDLDALPYDDGTFENVQCDNRPLRHLASSPADHAAGSSTVYHGLVDESDAVEAIYGAEWESLYTTGSDGVAPGLNAALTEFKNNARGVIFDHRSGNGGTILGPNMIWQFAVPRHPVSVYYDRAFFDEAMPSLEEGLARFQAGVDGGFADFAGSAAATTMPVALLLTRDVSASDWLPLGLKGASPNVKIFAPFETNGGFSTRYSFGYWLGVDYVMAVGDTFDVTGQTRNARGVPPDIEVLPKQSDLLVGNDTVYLTALAWVRSQLEGSP